MQVHQARAGARPGPRGARDGPHEDRRRESLRSAAGARGAPKAIKLFVTCSKFQIGANVMIVQFVLFDVSIPTTSSHR